MIKIIAAKAFPIIPNNNKKFPVIIPNVMWVIFKKAPIALKRKPIAKMTIIYLYFILYSVSKIFLNCFNHFSGNIFICSTFNPF